MGATATFGPLLRHTLTKVKQLDAFMQNFYKGNATKLGEWQTASRVQRAAKRGAKVQTSEGAKVVSISSSTAQTLEPSDVAAPAFATEDSRHYTNGNGLHGTNGANGHRVATV